MTDNRTFERGPYFYQTTSQLSRRRRGQAGFTLIELLVVIIILGILSAIVVFAVRGADDKGEANARATDRRIIRTALEVYCAQNDHYPEDPDGNPATRPDAMDVLVDARLLSARSTYHKLTTGNTAEFTEGSCGNTVGRYKLDGGPATGSGTCDDPPATWRSGLFCETGTLLPGSAVLYSPGDPLPSPVQLLDGRVLYLLWPKSESEAPCGPFQIQLYTPGTGQWASGPTGTCDPDGRFGVLSGKLVHMVVISDAAGQDKCSPNCGKVLFWADAGARYRLERWYLYDPDAPAETSLTDITPDPPPGERGWEPPGGGVISLVQILGTSATCDTNCGRILIARPGKAPSDPQDANTPPPFRLFDPTSLTPKQAFTAVASPVSPYADPSPVLVHLRSGKVLVFGQAIESSTSSFAYIRRPFAMIFDPANGNFDTSTPPPLHMWHPISSTSVLLATNEVLVTGYGTIGPLGNTDYTSEIFDPEGTGWRSVPSCVPSPTGQWTCWAIAAFGNQALARTAQEPQWAPQYGSGDVYLFDRGAEISPGTWTKLNDPPPKESLGLAITLKPPGCDPYCGKVLVVGQGDKPAYLYAP